MKDYLNKIADQVTRGFFQLPPKKQIAVVAAVVLTVGSLVTLILWANKTDYKTLYAGLSSEDAGAVVSRLKEKKIDYKVGPNGSTIMVPSGSVYELRMELASEGLPQSSGIGYEIFDKQNIGVTEFVQKVNFQRALQGELARTINQFSEVKSSRVHLTIPEKTLFREDEKPPTASVVVDLRAGRRLGQSQIQGITHLVASSVEGMDPENVIIVDEHGKMLAGGKTGYEKAHQTQTQQQMQSEMERKIEQKIISMLGNVVGHEKVSAKVSVEMDFTQVEQTEETYDPDATVVLSEERTKESSSGQRPVSSGVPGVMSNTPDVEGAQQTSAGVNKSNYNKSRETVNYEVSTVKRHVVNQVGAIRRLNVAVLIDGVYEMRENEEGETVPTYVPRSDEEMNKYTTLVKRAVGYDDMRGDSVEVVNVQFQQVEAAEETALERLVKEIDWESIITYIITAILFAVFFIFGLRPILRMISSAMQEAPQPRELPERRPGEAAEGEMLPPSAFEEKALEQLGEKQTGLVTFAQKNPRLFAQYLKNWLQ